jgi:hypothetical protein
MKLPGRGPVFVLARTERILKPSSKLVLLSEALARHKQFMEQMVSIFLGSVRPHLVIQCSLDSGPHQRSDTECYCKPNCGPSWEPSQSVLLETNVVTECTGVFAIGNDATGR